MNKLIKSLALVGVLTVLGTARTQALTYDPVCAGPTATVFRVSAGGRNASWYYVWYGPNATYVTCGQGLFDVAIAAQEGATYAWTGPNGFTSAAQNPTIPNATTAATGNYSVTVTVNGCTYTVQWAEGPTGPWTELKLATAGSNGLFEVTDSQPPPPPQRYYRTVHP